MVGRKRKGEIVTKTVICLSFISSDLHQHLLGIYPLQSEGCANMSLHSSHSEAPETNRTVTDGVKTS